MKLATAIVLLFSLVEAAQGRCKIQDLTLDKADNFIYEIDAGRKNLMAMTDLATNPVDKMSIRIVHDDVELTIAYHAILGFLSTLHSQMKIAADRDSVDDVFSRLSDGPLAAARSTADYLTVWSAETHNTSIAREALSLRDKLRQYETLLTCPEH